MRSAGYTLIELLVVISIISIMSVVGFVNFKGFSAEQVPIKAVSQIQSLLRLAQSNATSSTLCGNTSGNWLLIFTDDKNINLACGSTPTVQKTYTLENAQIKSIIGSDCGTTSVVPLTITYSAGVGALTFSSSSFASFTCLSSSTWTFTLKNTLDNSKTKIFKLSKGGAINVE